MLRRTFFPVLLVLGLLAGASPAEVWRQSETGSTAIHGTWTWDAAKGAYVARWQNGAVALIKVQSHDPNNLVLVRTDAANSSSAGLTARYTGKRHANAMSGSVAWTMNGRTWSGTWEANHEAAPAASGPHGSPGNPLSAAEASALFAQMAGQQDIAFRYVIDGCYARTHLMMRRMQARGIQARKVWSFARAPQELIHIKTPLVRGGHVDWDYHVAPVVAVRYSNGVFNMVIDPSLFKAPVTVDDWKHVQRSTAGHDPYVTIAGFAERPVQPNGSRAAGTYWPGVDPPNLDQAAKAKMAEYKALEPR